jgi:hypothetical protein
VIPRIWQFVLNPVPTRFLLLLPFSVDVGAQLQLDWNQVGQAITHGANYFGARIALSADGETVAVASIPVSQYGETTVLVFQKNPTNQTYLQVATEDNILRCTSVAISADGTVIAQGDPTIFVYQKNNSIQVYNKIAFINSIQSRNAGFSLSLSADGKTVAFGAPLLSRSLYNTTGQAHVYQFNQSNQKYSQIGLDIIGEGLSPFFGWSLAMSQDGSTIAIGAPNDPNNRTDPGHVRVFKKDSNQMYKQLGPDIIGEAGGNEFGYSLAISADGTVIVVGAPSNNGTGTVSGHVRIYQKKSSDQLYKQIGSDIDGEVPGERFGHAVAISATGTTIAVSSFNRYINNDTGSVRVFRKNLDNQTYSQIGKKISGALPGDRFGSSLAMTADGSTIAVGAPSQYSSRLFPGQVRLFTYSSPTPTSVTTQRPMMPTTQRPIAPTTQRPIAPTICPRRQPIGVPIIRPPRSSIWRGDPHITTFDGLRYGCQARGEFILLKSLNSTLHIQGRFTNASMTGIPSTASVTSGIVIRETGAPTIQVSYKTALRSTNTTSTVAGCRDLILFYENGVARPINTGSSSSNVSVSFVSQDKILIVFSTCLEVHIFIRGSLSFGCFFTQWVELPTNYRPRETLTGLLGNANGNPNDDWQTTRGTILSPQNVFYQGGYDFCRNEWCLRNASDSLFKYSTGESFATYFECNAPYRSDVEVSVTAASPAVRQLCGTDIQCLIDGAVGNITDAQSFRNDTVQFETARMERNITYGFNTTAPIQTPSAPMKAPSIPTKSPTVPTKAPSSAPSPTRISRGRLTYLRFLRFLRSLFGLSTN